MSVTQLLKRQRKADHSPRAALAKTKTLSEKQQKQKRFEACLKW
jgi:hypothetical protein